MVFKKKQPDTNVVVGKKEKLSTRLKRKYQNSTKKQQAILGACGLILAVLVVGGLYGYGQIQTQRISDKANLCESNYGTLQDVNSKIITYSVSADDPTIKTIEGYKNSSSNPDCLYVLTSYYIVTNDIEKAEKYYALIEPQKGVVLNGSLKEGISEDPVQYLGKRIDLMKRVQEEDKTNFRGTGYNTEEQGGAQ